MTGGDFDTRAGVEAKEEGIHQVSENAPDFLQVIRQVAREHSARHGRVTVDDLRDWAKKNGLVPHHQNAWGAIFRGAGWKIIGRTKSALVSNHARVVHIWHYDPFDTGGAVKEPSKNDLKKVLPEIRALYKLARQNGTPFSAELLKVCAWLSTKAGVKRE